LEVQTHGDQGYDQGYDAGYDQGYDAGYDESYDESISGVSTQVEVKVSVDDGETWTRRMINMGGELDESGLKAGEVVQLQGEKYRVLAGDDGLRMEPIRKPVAEKKKAKRR